MSTAFVRERCERLFDATCSYRGLEPVVEEMIRCVEDEDSV